MSGVNLGPFSPAATYGDIINLNANGAGLTSVPVQWQDGYGNLLNVYSSTALINFDRGVGQFQLDGVALTASAATLNNLSVIGDAAYILSSANGSLPNSSVLAAGLGISLTAGAGNTTIAVTGELAGLDGLNTTGLMVRSGAATYTTTSIVPGDATITVTNGDGVSGNPSLIVNPSTSIQKIVVESEGSPISTRSTINLIAGLNMGITVQDNSGLGRTDIYLTAAFDQFLSFKTACYAATTATLNALYNNGVSGIGATLTNSGALAAFSVDGVSPPITSRILVKNQTNAAYNGIYTLTTVGSGAVAWVLTRATDFDTVALISPGDFTNVINGTVNFSSSWIQTQQVTTIGTDDILFSSFGFSGTVTSVTGTANRITVANPTTTPVIDIAATYVGQTSITTLGTLVTGTWNATPVTVPFGGTGLTTLTTAYGVVCAGTTATGVLQNAGAGTAGQILTSGGAASLPVWVSPALSIFAQVVTQVAHGLAVGNVIRCTGASAYAKAQANISSNAEVIGIVTSVVSANVFIYQFGGIVSGLTVSAGSVYFLDPAVAGGYTATAPSVAPQVSKPLFIAISSTEAIWMNQRGQVL